ncbi:MAG: hypothetical protein WBB17_13385 [Saprospiraceae bacterium]
MEELNNIYKELERIESNAGLVGVVIVLIIALLLFGLYYYLKNFLSYWGKETFKKELEEYKKELNASLGTLLIEKFSKVQESIAILETSLRTSKSKKLIYHSEKIDLYKKIYKSIIMFYQEYTNSSHSGMDKYDPNSIEKRINYLDNFNADLNYHYSGLQLYCKDEELLDSINKIQLGYLTNLEPIIMDYLLELKRKSIELKGKEHNIGEYKDCLINITELHSKYCEKLHEYIRGVADERHEFIRMFREKYMRLLEDET